MFESLDTSLKSKIKLGTDKIVEVMGKGAINVITKLVKNSIPDVYFVPSLKHNLISIGKLIQKGYRVAFENNVCTILDIPPKNMVIVKVEIKNNRMFPLHMKNEMIEEIEAGFKASGQDKSLIWHLKYGNLNFIGLCLLKRK